MSDTTKASPGTALTTLPQGGEGWDAFAIMDRLDEDLIAKELEGIAADELVYVVVDERGKEVVGLSKAGVDECCMLMAKQGEVIREEPAVWSVIGNGEDREAFFQVTAARYAVSQDGLEVKLDQAIGVKRQSLYYEARSMSLDGKVGFGKHRTKTWRELVDSEDGKHYLQWIVNYADKLDEQTKRFAQAVLDGEEVEIAGGRKLNQFWFEHGSMKAARNARFRLIPAPVRARVAALGRETNRTRVVTSEAPPTMATTATSGPPSSTSASPGDDVASPEQLARLEKLLKSTALMDDERQEITDWLVTGNVTGKQAVDAEAKLRRKLEKRGAKDLPPAE